ncbi:hypothetical protein BDQ12DRAFT_721319 [Crucibulum laeve]|uniref:DUF202 domain-containing protein n=1 Tax=Crucibulum laeve TaxID=68775 RepID=A0A5C3MA63_9AGAR|nr:hypothetical protein BDQ12DRAFT_721319 [Crucibulum laeve]
MSATIDVYNGPSHDRRDDTDAHVSEATPLIRHSRSSSRSTRSIRSYNATHGFLPKRRVRPKASSKGSRRNDHALSTSSSSSILSLDEDVEDRRYAVESNEVASNSTVAVQFNEASNSIAQPKPTKPSLFSALSSKINLPVPEGVSLTLHNSGSVARDHLASERTFLAYMRTSLAIASSGVALVQLFTAASASTIDHHPGGHRLHAYVRPLGATTVTIGILVLLIGVVRYFTVQAALTKGHFPAARIATGFIAFALAALVTATFGILMAGKLEPKRSGH